MGVLSRLAGVLSSLVGVWVNGNFASMGVLSRSLGDLSSESFA